MAIITPSSQLPGVFVPKSTITNGGYPQSGTGRSILEGYNHVLVYRRKTIMSHFADLETLSTTQTSATKIYHGRFRTGEVSSVVGGPLRIHFQTLLGPSGNSEPGTFDPFAKWSLVKVSDSSTTTTTELHFGPYKAPPWGPSSITQWAPTLEAEGNTEYEFFLTCQTKCRAVGCCVYERHATSIDDTAAIVSKSGDVTMGLPITDARQTQIQANPYTLWRRNGSHLFAWGLDEDPDVGGGNAPTRTSATAANAFDQSKTAFATGDRGVKVQLQYHSPAHAPAVVPCVFAARGKNAGSAGGNVTLRGASGLLATLSSFSTAGQWKSTIIELDGSIDTHELQFYIAGDGTNLFTLSGLSIYEHE